MANRQVVVDACEFARGAGVRLGLSLAEARALCPGLEHEEHDPSGDAKALEALGRWMMRFSPTVQCVGAGSSCGLFLDVTGTQRLFGSLENLIERVGRSLARLRIRARLAIAPTPGAAWALTYADRPRSVVKDRDELMDVLAALPPAALRLDGETLALLHHLGLENVGQILRLPRDMLPVRFGEGLLLRIDQALGRVAEPLEPLVWQEPIEASIDFDGVVDSLEALWQAFGGLIERVVGQLVRLGAGARRLSVTFVRPYAESIERTIELSSPSRNAGNLFNLIRCTMETIGEARRNRGTLRLRSGQAPAQRFCLREPRELQVNKFVPNGFVGLRLAVPVFERLSEEQIRLLEQDEHVGRQELDRLIERMRIRLGEQALVRVGAVECYVPERAYKTWHEQLTCEEKRHEQAAHATGQVRPLHLLPRPREIAVMVRPSHDRDGAPISFTLDGRTRAIVYAVGPERIAGAWWDGHNKTRDYFDIEDEQGRRWWVFRVFQTSRWFLHGEFE